MDVKKEAAEFLRTRRSRLTPERAGLPVWGGARRVPGLRREEVALLAGVSAEYYVRLERGHLGGVSESVLEAVANTLQLDEAERSHLYDLARAASSRHRNPVPRRVVRPAVQWLLDSMTGTAAYVRNPRTDLLAANTLGRALYAPVYEMAGPPNVARFVFLDPRAGEFFTDWEQIGREAAALLRTMAGGEPVRPRTHPPRRGTVDAQRPLPHPVGRPRRPAASHWHQTIPPPGGRRPDPRLRRPGPDRRPRSAPQCLRRRTRHPLR